MSCIKVSFKGLYSYYNVANKEKPTIFFKTNDLNLICSKKKDSNYKVLIINGSSLKQCIKENTKSIIYMWSPNCHSKNCIPLQLIQKHCEENNYKLYVVSEYYDSDKMDYEYGLSNSLYAIDTEFYKTDLTTKYLDKFFKDIDLNLVVSSTYNRYFYFEKDKFIQSFDSIDEIK